MELLGLFNGLYKYGKATEHPGKAPAIQDWTHDGAILNTLDCRKGEASSTNGNCSGRGLARVAAIMANGGSFKGIGEMEFYKNVFYPKR